MNPQLTISVLAILLLANSITALVYWFRLRAFKGAEIRQRDILLEIRAESIIKLSKDNAELQSKLNAAKDALK